MQKHNDICPGLLSDLSLLIAEHLNACRTTLAAPDDPHDAVHEVRRRLKIVRAVVRLARDHLGSSMYREYNRFYRDLGRAVQQYRDAQSLIETTGTIGKHYDAFIQSHVIASLREAYTLARDRMSKESLDAALTSIRDRLVTLPLADEHRPELSRKNFIKSIARVYRRGKREYLRTRKRRSDTTMHDWRKRAKYLRYQMEILAAPDIPAFSETAKRLHELTDVLGDHHNLELLQSNLRAHRDRNDRDTEGLLALIQVQQKHLWKKSLQMGKELYTLRPKYFAEGIADMISVRGIA